MCIFVILHNEKKAALAKTHKNGADMYNISPTQRKDFE